MNTRVKRQLAIAGGIVLLIAVVIVGPQVLARVTARKAATPALATAAYQSFPVLATASGIVLPQRLINVSFPIAGQIQQISVSVGTAVTAGQQLAKLDDTTELAELQAAQAAVSAANEAVSAAASSNNPAARAAAASQLASAQAELVRAQADETRTILTAPQPGTVLQVNAEVGQSVAAGTTGVPSVAGSSTQVIDPTLVTNPGANRPVFAIGDPTSFQVSAPFSQADATQLQTGQSGSITFDALPGVTLPCSVEAIATAATLINGVPEYYAAAALNGNDQRLRSGLTATVSITVASANHVLAVPNQAVYSLDTQNHVDVWRNGARVSTVVATGLIGSTLTQITSGLTQGDQVVLTPSSSLPTPRPT